jgi:DNA-binding CsgD family transcriptional regulator
VATALERAAGRATERGAPEAAAALLERSRALTPAATGWKRVRRGLEAADRHFEAGETARARALLEEILSEVRRPPRRADVLRRLGWLAYHERSYGEAVELLERARAEAGEGTALRALIERDLAWAAILYGDPHRAADHARAALPFAQQASDPAGEAEALTALGVSETILGRGPRRDLLLRTIELEELGAGRDRRTRSSRSFAVLLKWGDDLDGARARYETLARRARDRGDDSSIPGLLHHLSDVELRAGNWEIATRHAAEGYDVATRTGQRPMMALLMATRALVSAHRGSAEAASEADRAAALAEAVGMPGARMRAKHATALLRLSMNDPEGAVAALGPALDEAVALELLDPDTLRAAPDLIEALVATNEADRATRLLALFELRMSSVSPVWSACVAGRSRGLLLAERGELRSAIEELERALEGHGDLDQPFERARTLLIAGAVDRRLRRRRDARTKIGHAAEIFASLGAALWSALADAERARLGVRTSTPATLSATEHRVAELVAAGLTNREIAAALSLSPKTVEWNLSKIYRKLGVRSRAELAARR